jgi:D-alanine-D-alanine ligase-like ATP-grasp enzyme
MSLNYDSKPFSKGDQDWLIWILAPFVKTEDPNLQYYYDFSQSIGEYTKVFKELDLNWKWQAIEISNYKEIIRNIQSESSPRRPLVINLCDGDEDNGVPGISVIRELELNDLIYTGSDTYFYDITTSKIPMKKLFDQYQVPTSPWMVIDIQSYDPHEVFQKLKKPLIVKPAISGGSLGLGLKSVVQDEQEMKSYLNSIINGYKGWDLTSGGFFIEEFIQGQEYTTLIVGPSDDLQRCTIYDPVERVFESSIPATEQFLSFDRLWEIYEEESPIEQDKALWNYSRPNPALIDEIKSISWKAYQSVKGMGYGRVDLRRDQITGKIMVLEVNAQCGLSDDENFTSIGAILRLCGERFTELIYKIIQDAYQRYQLKHSMI